LNKPINKRSRGRNNGRRSQHPGNRTFDSNGPEVKVRGSASQICDKYLALARDASSSGDRVRAESLLQHAEHYFRLINGGDDARNERGGQNQNARRNRAPADAAVAGEMQMDQEAKKPDGPSRRERAMAATAAENAQAASTEAEATSTPAADNTAAAASAETAEPAVEEAIVIAEAVPDEVAPEEPAPEPEVA